MDWRYLLWFFGLGMFSIVVVRTSFNPNAEYLQSLEPAHKMVFGYGKLTWEWSYYSRSYAYPSIIAVIYKLLAILHLDYVEAVIYAPRILQAMISAIGHCYTCELGRIISEYDLKFWTAAALSTNWLIFVCMSRTLYVGIENICMIIAMKSVTWFAAVDRDQIRILTVLFICCFIQPSSVFLFSSVIYLQRLIKLSYHNRAQPLFRWRYRHRILLEWVIALVFLIFIDYSCYGTFWITPWQMLKLINYVPNSAHRFGWLSFFYFFLSFFWYILIGLPFALFTHLVVAGFSVWKFYFYPIRGIFRQCVWIVCWYSLFMRNTVSLLLPVVSLSCIMIGLQLHRMEMAHKRRKRDNLDPKWILGFLFITNLPMAYIFGYQQRQGTLPAMQFLAHDKTPDNLMNITFLMPCNTMPAYSHLHRNVSLRFLSCEPNLDNMPKLDENAKFYDDPNVWISENNLNASTHIVIFDSLKDYIGDFLHNFKLCARIFHTSYDPKQNYVEIYCK